MGFSDGVMFFIKGNGFIILLRMRFQKLRICSLSAEITKWKWLPMISNASNETPVLAWACATIFMARVNSSLVLKISGVSLPEV